MQAADFLEFKASILRFRKLWPKQDIDDELLQVYWRALKDQPIATFRRFCENHEKFGRQFPKPSDLQPKPEKGAADPQTLGAEGDTRSARNLEQLRRINPDAWKVEVQIRQLNRIIATQPMGSVMYDTAIHELHQLGYSSGRWPNP